jgi:hypothetical protein
MACPDEANTSSEQICPQYIPRLIDNTVFFRPLQDAHANVISVLLCAIFAAESRPRLASPCGAKQAMTTLNDVASECLHLTSS